MLNEKVAQEIVDMILEQGRLTKADIVETWGITDAGKTVSPLRAFAICSPTATMSWPGC